MMDDEGAQAEAPEGISPPRPPQPVDIEDLLQWALSRSGRLPWRRDDDRELTLNPYDARPKRRDKIGWATAEVYALTINGRTRVLAPRLRVPGADAERVMVAIAMLGDSALSEQVRACARSRIRPDWMPGVVPVRVEDSRRCRRKHKRMRRFRWSPCSPEDVRAAREAYARWHAALCRLATELDGELAGWRVEGPAAPAAPWLGDDKKSG